MDQTPKNVTWGDLSSPDLDFTLHRQVPQLTADERIDMEKAGLLSPPICDVPSPLALDEPGKQSILAIPHLHSIKIYDNSYMCRFYRHPGIEQALDNPARFWFVHYVRSDSPVMVGAGTVIVIERGTGKVVYKGSDGME